MDAKVAEAGGQGTDLLSVFNTIHVCNEEKIPTEDRLFCEKLQEQLHKSLYQLDEWYMFFQKEAEKYKESHKLSYKPDGSVSLNHVLRTHDRAQYGFTGFEFTPFETINAIVKNRKAAATAFVCDIISYFNEKYHISVTCSDNPDDMIPGFRPVYQKYVDLIISHLGGRNFRETAEDELLKRFHAVVCPGWKTKIPELKNDKIIFHRIFDLDDFYFFYQQNRIHYRSSDNIQHFCAGIALGGSNALNGDLSVIIGLDTDNVDLSRWYDLATEQAGQVKFYKNGRIDVRFRNETAAEECFRKLRLNQCKQNKEEN